MYLFCSLCNLGEYRKDELLEAARYTIDIVSLCYLTYIQDLYSVRLFDFKLPSTVVLHVDYVQLNVFHLKVWL